MSKSSRKQKRRTRARADWRTRALTLRDQLVDALPVPTDELELAVERFQTGIEEIEWETEKRAQRFLRRIRTSAFGKQIQAMPKQVVSGVDRLLDSVGLMRIARHEAMMARDRARAKRRKPAAAVAA